MSGADFERLLELYDQVVELPEDQREAFLARACGEDTALRAELDAMLERSAGDASLETPDVPPDEVFGPAPEGPVPGARLGEFELLERLGEGGMGVVFKARQLNLDRLVALKVLRRAPLLGGDRVSRFDREFKAIAKLRHPGIVSVHQAGVSEGTRYFAMDLVEGDDLGAELGRLRAEAERLGVDSTRLSLRGAESYVRAVVRIVRDAADALQYAHDRDIVHRDIKPSNLLLDEQGTVRLVDFGLARDLTLETVTGAGELGGTPAYMSPEQADAKLHESVTARSDIYSLGVVLYELLTLQRPHEGRTERELLEAIRDEIPRALRSHNQRLPRDLEAIVSVALAKRPEERYASAGALRDDLDRVLRHEAVHARHPSWAVLLKRWARRRWLPLAVAAGTLLAAWGAFAYGRSAERRAEADVLVASLFGLAPEGDVGALDPAAQVRMATLCARVGEAAAWLDDEVLEQVRGLERDLSGEVALRRDDLLARFAAIEGPGGDSAFERAERLVLSVRAAELVALRPDDAALARLADPAQLLPRLAVTVADEAGRPVPARVVARRLDVFSTQPREPVDLGPAPVEVALDPGLYRVVVRFDDGAQLELSRDLLDGGVVQAEVQRRPWPEDRTTDMVLFDATTYTLPVEPDAYVHLVGESVTLEPFWLDRYEVSNADYLEFLAAHAQAELPKFWGAERPEGWERLPVTGLSWLEMRAYAEWRGKRLPTFAEWNWAARGASMRRFPWSETSDELPACVPVGQELSFQSLEEAWQHYLTHARPVDGCPESATPEGLQHLYGNANEFTESVWIQRDDDGHWSPLFSQRLLAGKSWTVWYPIEDLRFQGYSRTDRHSAQTDIGFRLALSADP